jgi:predicted RNase H-like HicB family nuclease
MNNGSNKGVSHKISVVIEKDEFGYYAYCPELVGCQTQGDSLDEVLANIKEAVDAYVSTLSDEEKREIVSKEILTTNIEVAIA